MQNSVSISTAAESEKLFNLQFTSINLDPKQRLRALETEFTWILNENFQPEKLFKSTNGEGNQ